MDNELNFLYDDFTIINKEELDNIVKTVSKKPELSDPKAVFLKRFAYEVFNAYRRSKITKKLEKEIEIIKKEVKPVVLEKPVIKPEIKKIILEKPPRPIYKKILPIREILRSDGVVIKAAYNNGIYNLIEPELNEGEVILLSKLEKEIGSKILKDKKLGRDIEFIKKNVNKIAKKIKLSLNVGVYDKINYFLLRDVIGFGKIDGLLRDVHIKEIICDGVGKPLKLNYKGEDAVSDVLFNNKNELDNIILKFSELANKKLSEKEPFLSAILPSGIRIQASLSSDLTNSRFVIKK